MKIVKESLIYEKKSELNLTAGLVIIQDNKILLVHPTKAPWYNTYSIPKGHVEKNETLIDAAVRETYEETGILIAESKIIREEHFVDYIDKKGILFKRVYYYLAYPTKPINPGDFKLQKGEVDWAGFLTKKEAKNRIFWRFKEILEYLK